MNLATLQGLEMSMVAMVTEFRTPSRLVLSRNSTVSLCVVASLYTLVRALESYLEGHWLFKFCEFFKMQFLFQVSEMNVSTFCNLTQELAWKSCTWWSLPWQPFVQTASAWCSVSWKLCSALRILYCFLFCSCQLHLIVCGRLGMWTKFQVQSEHINCNRWTERAGRWCMI